MQFITQYIDCSTAIDVVTDHFAVAAAVVAISIATASFLSI